MLIELEVFKDKVFLLEKESKDLKVSVEFVYKEIIDLKGIVIYVCFNVECFENEFMLF